MNNVITSDGGPTEYYELPSWATELQHLIEHKQMNFAVGNIFKASYRLGEKSGTSLRYDLRKIIRFAEFELARLDREEPEDVYDKPHPALGPPLDPLRAYPKINAPAVPELPEGIPAGFQWSAIDVPAQRTLRNTFGWRSQVAEAGDTILYQLSGYVWKWSEVKDIVRNMTGDNYRVSPHGTQELLVPFNHVFAIRRHESGELDLGYRLTGKTD